MRLTLLLLGALGCDARFVDLRPSSLADASITDTLPDTAAADAGADTSTADSDAGMTVDASTGSDASMADTGAPDTGTTSTVIAQGRFQGRSGYDAAGGVRIESLGGSAYVVVLEDDFESAAVPGPAVVVTARDAIGTALVDADILVTRLTAAQIRGPGRYTFDAATLPADPYVFIYCEPFGVETARAATEAP